MNRLLKAVGLFSVFLTLSISSLSASAAVTTQLGFLLDESGSVGSANYQLLKQGLHDAIAALPTDGSVEITVVTYGSSTSTAVPPTVLDATTLAAIQAGILGDSYSGGSTDTAGGITTLANLMRASANWSAGIDTFINISTDGVPNSQTAAVAAAAAAAANGIDTISLEAIGSGVSSASALANMAAVAAAGSNGKPVATLAVNSTAIPYPGTSSFVVPVSNFAVYADVIEAKVIASVTPTPVPLPGTLALIAIGALCLVVRSHAR